MLTTLIFAYLASFTPFKWHFTIAYEDTDDFESGKIYYYSTDSQYRWIDPNTIKSSSNPPTDVTKTSVRIINKHDDIIQKIVIKNNEPTEKIILDGANKIISSTNTRRIFGDDFENWQWLELCDNGTHELTIEGNCKVSLSKSSVSS